MDLRKKFIFAQNELEMMFTSNNDIGWSELKAINVLKLNLKNTIQNPKSVTILNEMYQL